MNDEASGGVNSHYLDHVVATSQTHEVAATEDIVAGNGIKLLAKGARIDAATRDRLLQHKLRKPLENCVEVADGITTQRFEAIAEVLLQRHPLLHALCASTGARPVPASLARLTLSRPMRSLLTVHALSQADRLEHAVGVAMVAMSLAHRLLPEEIERHRMLATAGLVHDIGELYIDPVYLRKETRLNAEQWRHIVAHPVVGHRVLREMAGAGYVVADAVLQHHERLDGFGYPQSVHGDAFTLNGQILAAAEWLMALAESGSSPLTRAGMAIRMIPGEFSPDLLQAVSSMARESPDAAVELTAVTPLAHVVPRIERLAASLRRFRESRAMLDQQIAQARPGLREVLRHGFQRLQRIQSRFYSSGLDAASPELLLEELAALQDPAVYTEVTALIGEMEWRMRELEREQRLRASVLSPQEEAVINQTIEVVKGARAGSAAPDA
jgi:HD-GYP domain-containing protein (c-di-GMP phosphodiesterase class II)